MASRFYHYTDEVVDLTPSSWSTGWTKTTGSGTDIAQQLKKGGGSGSSTNRTPNGGVGDYTAGTRIVSAPLKAGTISGTVKGQLLAKQTNATDDYTLALAVKAVKSDGTDRGIILAVTGSDDVSAAPPELATSYTNRKFRDISENTAISLSSLAVSDGDRLVIEYGFRQSSTSTATASYSINNNQSGSDLAEDDSSTGFLNPWFEFSNDIYTYETPVYVGSASTPTDGAAATNTADPTAVTPPSGMLAGDLVVMIGQERSAGTTLSVSAAGGQTWNSLTAIGTTNQTARVFWCTFNGTWGTNPSVDFGGTTCNTVVMHVFRPTRTDYTWDIDVAQVELDIAAAATQTITGQTTLSYSTVAVAGWFTADDNTWGSISGANWLDLGNSQYRNTSGSDQSCTFAYARLTSPGPTGNVSKTQLTLGNDAATTFIVTFKQVAPTAAAATAAITGTVTSAATEADIVAGGKTIIITLTGDTWVASGATFDAERQNIINGLDSAQAEGTGWDAVVKAGEAVTSVVRTSATVVTITLSAFATYDITATETITVTVPSTAVTGGVAIVATPTFTVSPVITSVPNSLMMMGMGS